MDNVSSDEFVFRVFSNYVSRGDEFVLDKMFYVEYIFKHCIIHQERKKKVNNIIRMPLGNSNR